MFHHTLKLVILCILSHSHLITLASIWLQCHCAFPHTCFEVTINSGCWNVNRARIGWLIESHRWWLSTKDFLTQSLINLQGLGKRSICKVIFFILFVIAYLKYRSINRKRDVILEPKIVCSPSKWVLKSLILF